MIPDNMGILSWSTWPCLGGAKPSKMVRWQMQRACPGPTVAPEAGQRLLSHLVSHPDLLTTVAALFYYPPWRGPSHCALSLCVARDLGWCDHDHPRCGGHTPASALTLPALGSPASVRGSELLQDPSRGSDSLLCPATMPPCQPALTFVDNGGRHPRGSPITLQALIFPPLGSCPSTWLLSHQGVSLKEATMDINNV